MKDNEVLFNNIYNNARDFNYISQRILVTGKEAIGDKIYATQAIVNGIFAIELYIKAILAYEGKTLKRIKKLGKHELDELFKLISKKRQKELNGDNICEFLKRESRAFINWRYSYEFKYLNISMQELKMVLDIFEEECKKIKNEIDKN